MSYSFGAMRWGGRGKFSWWYMDESGGILGIFGGIWDGFGPKWINQPCNWWDNNISSL